MTPDWDENNRAMRKHQGRGPGPDPRGPHHRQYTPNPDFIALCDRAEQRGVQVHLQASKTLLHPDDDVRSRRDLQRVRLLVGDSTVASGFLTDTNLTAVSRRLLEQLG